MAGLPAASVNIVGDQEAIIDSFVIETLNQEFLFVDIDKAQVSSLRLCEAVHARHEHFVSLEMPVLCFSKWTSNPHEEPFLVRATIDVSHVPLLSDPHHSGKILCRLVGEDLVFVPGVIIWV